MDVPGNKFPSMWTVPVLSVGMYKSWTAGDKWTGCPPFAHPHLGQVLDWTIDLTTAPWITARLDVTVNHTDHKLRTRIFLNDLEHRKGTQTDQFLFGDSGFTPLFSCVPGVSWPRACMLNVKIEMAKKRNGKMALLIDRWLSQKSLKKRFNLPSRTTACHLHQLVGVLFFDTNCG
jgi:hypothetical protein